MYHPWSEVYHIRYENRHPVPCPSHAWFHTRYGNQRLWGAVGFGVVSLIGGYLCDAADGSYDTVTLFFVAVMVVALVASTGVPAGRSDEVPGGKEKPSR